MGGASRQRGGAEAEGWGRRQRGGAAGRGVGQQAEGWGRGRGVGQQAEGWGKQAEGWGKQAEGWGSSRGVGQAGRGQFIWIQERNTHPAGREGLTHIPGNHSSISDSIWSTRYPTME